MKKYLKENKFSFIALIIEVIVILLIIMGLVNENILSIYFQFALMIGALVLTIVGFIKDKKKILSIISTILIVIYIVFIIYLIYYYLVVFPKMLPIFLDEMMKSFGIGG